MGRTEPTVVRPPAASRRDARAKRARATANRLVPAMLAAHPRARRGVDASELIVDPPPASSSVSVPVAQHQHQHRPQQGRVGREAGAGAGKGGGRRGAGGDAGAARGGKSGGRQRGGKRRMQEDGDGHGHEGDGAEGSGPLLTTSPASIAAVSPPVSAKSASPRLTLRSASALAAAHALVHSSPSPQSPAAVASSPSPAASSRRRGRVVGVLNMASPLAPGGGFLGGAATAEAALCARTTLLPALRDDFYRLPELGVVYTPDVLVFRHVDLDGGGGGGDDEDGENDDGGGILPRAKRWFVDVASAAMLRLPETESEGDAENPTRRRYAREQDREMAVRKMRAVLRVLQARGCHAVVLGAWGCGAAGHPVGEVARAWRRVLLPGRNTQSSRHRKRGGQATQQQQGVEVETWAGIDQVVFAIPDSGLAGAFAGAFGNGLEVEEASHRGTTAGSENEDEEDDDVDADDPAERTRRELRAKIRELEAQVQHARTPHLRAGLAAVLAGLRTQLPEDSEPEAPECLLDDRDAESGRRWETDESDDSYHTDPPELEDDTQDRQDEIPYPHSRPEAR
ncbi:hypothetical protein GGR56DRAFT_694227 [Xylariaceae sp. FL0804]|nr:hypothetical protein GGR56DRAFT_694227 [Xylariaceae sp. FL0804]